MLIYQQLNHNLKMLLVELSYAPTVNAFATPAETHTGTFILVKLLTAASKAILTY